MRDDLDAADGNYLFTGKFVSYFEEFSIFIDIFVYVFLL